MCKALLSEAKDLPEYQPQHIIMHAEILPLQK